MSRSSVSKWLSAEASADHGPTIHGISEATSRRRVCVCTGAGGDDGEAQGKATQNS